MLRIRHLAGVAAGRESHTQFLLEVESGTDQASPDEAVVVPGEGPAVAPVFGVRIGHA